MESKIKVLYIIGCGRSGSTVMSAILGEHSDIFCAGEVSQLVCDAWKDNFYCSCGVRGNQCEFWSEVYKIWLEMTQCQDLNDYLYLQRKFENFKSILSWWRISQNNQSPEFQKYKRWTKNIYEAIHKVSGKSIIIDASKNPARALALTNIAQIDLSFIHLIRDSRGVAWSLKKSYQIDQKAGIQKKLKSRPVWRTALFWTIVNLQANWVLSHINTNNYLRVTYESFVQDSENFLLKVGNIINCDFMDVIENLKQGKEIDFEHNIAGNFIRMKRQIKLSLDQEWVEKLPKQDQMMVNLLTQWLINRYYQQQ
jgi:hypothetical protein